MTWSAISSGIYDESIHCSTYRQPAHDQCSRTIRRDLHVGGLMLMSTVRSPVQTRSRKHHSSNNRSKILCPRNGR